MQFPSLAALAAIVFLGTTPHAQVRFSSDFEDHDPDCFAKRPAAGCVGWMSIRDACLSLKTGEKSHSGRTAMKIEFTKNENYGGSWRKADSRHIFTRFYEYYDQGFDFAAGMKIHRLSAFNEAKQVNDFDIILQTKADAPGANYCGLTDAKYIALAFNGGPVDWGSLEIRFTPERGRWYSIETEVKLNTPGKSDGEARIWVDGRLLGERKGVNMTGSISSSINRVMFGGWYSNSAAGKNPCPDPVSPSRRYIDDPVISDGYIGPIPTVAPGPGPRSRTLSTLLPHPGSLIVEYGKTPSYGLSAKAANSPNGAHSIVISGLDTNSTYHYRIKSAWSTGYAYVSPGYSFSTSAAGGSPPNPDRPKHSPKNLRAHQYDPIPD